MALYDEIDSDFTWDGDYVVDSKGDIQDTSQDTLLSLTNEIHSLCGAEFGDWEKHALFGVNLSEFRGEPNTRQTAARIEDRLLYGITSAGLVSRGDVSIRIVPVHIHRILIIININATATPNNNLTVGDTLSVSFTYDSLEDSVFFLPPSETAKQFLRS